MRNTVAALAMVGLALMVGGRSNASAEDFYKGKTMTIICPFSPGGTYDRMSRLASQFMPRYIPGEPTIIVQNRTGGGGLIGTRAAYKATPDGLTLLHIPSTYLFQALLGLVTDIDFTKWGWLGSVGGAHYIFYIRSALPHRSIDDLRGSQPIKIGVMGPGSSITETAKMIKEFGKFNVDLVPGYKGYADIALAIRQGEVDSVATAAATLQANPLTQSMKEENQIVLVMSLGGAKPPKKFAAEIAKLPNFRDHIADKTDLRAFDLYMGTFNITRPFLSTPGIPPDRLQILRDGLWKMMHDAEFVAAAEKQGFVLHPVRHDEVSSLVNDMFNLPKGVKDRLSEVFK
jgi:tripartite-type tricarboxylate transporter receptor subunit TctC